MAIKFSFKKDDPEKSKTLKIPIGFKKKPISDGFVLHWHEALGYSKDPFEPVILEPIDKFIAGHEKERQDLNLFIIKDKKFGTITGKAGTGKTILLKWLCAELSKHKMLCFYIDRKTTSIEEALKTNFTQKFGIFKKEEQKELSLLIKEKLLAKKLILLIDNFDEINKDEILFIEKLYSEVFMQVIVASSDDIKEKIKSAKDRQDFKDSLEMELKKLPYGSAKEMIKKRIESVGGKEILPFDDEYLRKMWEQSDGNPKKLLEKAKNSAIDLAVKTNKGMALKDAVTYQKEGIDLDNTEAPEIVLGQGKAEKEGDYTIKAVEKKYKDIVIENIDSKEEEKAKEYKIHGKKNE